MKRETFEAMSTELLARAERSMAWALTVAGLRPTDVESVELVRGGVRVPAVKQLVRKLFQREPLTTLKQDEAVARGCALQCAMLSPIFEVRDFVVVDAQPYPIELCYDPGKGEDIWAERDAHLLSEQAFNLEARNPQEAAAPHPDLQLDSFTENKVVSAAEGGASKIKVKGRLNLRGIFSVVSATGRGPQTGRSTGKCWVCKRRRPSGAEGEPVKKEERPSPKEKQARATELPVEVRVPQLSAFEMDQLVAREVQMVHTDRREKERLICQAM
ncbi:hypothetical protein HPB47_005410, partial [Ixodes persulcatus]